MPFVTRTLPEPVRPLLQLLSERLQSEFDADLAGVYVHGSIALGDYRHGSSDVDLLVVTERELVGDDRARVRRLHDGLRRDAPQASLLEGMYLSRAALSASDRAARHLYVKRGRLRPGGHRVGPTARAMARSHGVALFGPPAAELFPEVAPEAVVAEMDYNLNVYWARQLRRPYLYLFDAPVEFALLTLPRIVHTLETGTMISKGAAADLLRARYPQWEPLLAGTSSFPLGRLGRAVATIGYLRAMIEEGNRLLATSPPPRSGSAPRADRASTTSEEERTAPPS